MTGPHNDPFDDVLDDIQNPKDTPEPELKLSGKFARPDGLEVFTPGEQFIYDDENLMAGICSVLVKNGDFVYKVGKAIKQNNIYDVYESQGEVVELVTTDDGPHLEPISADRMMVVLDDSAPLIKTIEVRPKGNSKAAPYIKKIPVNADKRLCQLALGSLANENLLPIRVVTEYPTYLKGWEISKPGYNVGGVYYVEPLELEQLTDKIKNPRSPEVCRKWLDNLLVDFPFVNDEHKIRFISLMITAIIKQALDHNTPFFLVQAPRERTGKSKLINEVLGPTIFGRPPYNSSFPKEEAELNKTIIAMLIDGQPIFFFDNIETEVGGDLLCSMLTSRRIRGRILGLSKVANCHNSSVLVGTSNNATLHKDMMGRTVEIILSTHTPNPELRTDFNHPDIEAHASKYRLETLNVLFSMVENWRNAGCPDDETKIIGGFEKWSKVIGGILAANGYEQHFLENWNLEKADLDIQLAEFMEAMWQELPTNNGMVTATAEELFEIAKEHAYFAGLADERKYPNRHSQLTALGWMMKKILLRPVAVRGGYAKLRKVGERPARYCLEKTKRK